MQLMEYSPGDQGKTLDPPSENEASAIIEYIPNSTIKEGVNENPYHRSLREYPGVLSC